MDWRLAGIFCVLYVLCKTVKSNSSRLDESIAEENRTSELIQSLLNRMNPRVRPYASGHAVLVTVDSHIMAIGSIDEVSMDFKVDIYIRQTWRDPRLIYDSWKHPGPLTLTQDFAQDIWLPDSFFPNEKDARIHHSTAPNAQLKIFPNGTVAHSVRTTLKLSCIMDLHYYPLDRQQCFLHLGSFSYEEDQVRLAWQPFEPVTVVEDLRLPDMKLQSMLTYKTKKTQKIPGGTFDSLTIEFRIGREYRYFLLQSYIPSILIVILSWVSFWIDMKAVPARVTLSATAVLTMIAHVSGSKPDSPRVSYPKATDVWSLICLSFVFLALIEYAIVNALMRSKSDARYKKSDSAGDQEDATSDNKISRPGFLGFAHMTKARLLDHISRLFFPIAFLLINIVYWSYYLNPPPFEDHSK